jgi:hypothetical protein
MARGAAQQKDLLNQQAANSTAQANQVSGMELPVLQNQLQNPGYDPVTAAAIRRAGMDTTNTAFDASRDSAARRAGVTGNEAAFYGSANDLAMKRAQALSTAATGAEEDIGKQKLASQQQAITDASQLYGINKASQGQLYGEANNALSQTRGPFDWFNSILAGSKDAVGAVAGATQK